MRISDWSSDVCSSDLDETFVVEPSDGVLFHSNHWLSPVALAKLRETGISGSPCSFWRDQRARRLLASSPVIGMEEVRAVLLDDAGSPLSICVPPRPSRSEEHTSELQSLMRISYAVFCLQKKNTNT